MAFCGGFSGSGGAVQWAGGQCVADAAVVRAHVSVSRGSSWRIVGRGTPKPKSVRGVRSFCSGPATTTSSSWSLTFFWGLWPLHRPVRRLLTIPYATTTFWLAFMPNLSVPLVNSLNTEEIFSVHTQISYPNYPLLCYPNYEYLSGQLYLHRFHWSLQQKKKVSKQHQPYKATIMKYPSYIMLSCAFDFLYEFTKLPLQLIDVLIFLVNLKLWMDLDSPAYVLTCLYHPNDR